MAYAISGNQLSLIVNGQTIRYAKGGNVAQGNDVTPSAGGRRYRARISKQVVFCECQ